MEEIEKRGLDVNLFYVYLCMAGENQQGGPGCTYVDSDNGCAFYVHCEKLEPLSFRSTFRTTLDDDEKNHYFVVHKQSEQLHVVSFPREKAYAVNWIPYQEMIRDMNEKYGA